jgi:glutamyl-tRNA synthetase
LSKSKIVRGVQDGTYTGWDDPRLATFRALSRRGIQPEAIRQLILDIGPRPVDITLSWENLYAYNRKIIDPSADRYFFVQEPLKLTVGGVKKPYVARIPLHPDRPDQGHRTLDVEPKNGVAEFFVSSKDKALFVNGSILRLMELFNVQVKDATGTGFTSIFHSEAYEEARKLKAPLIHWLPADTGVACEVVMPDNSSAKGLVEKAAQNVFVGQIVQFERFGFVRVDQKGNKIVVFFAHK